MFYIWEEKSEAVPLGFWRTMPVGLDFRRQIEIHL
jgi:hypothetical protein